MSLFISQPMVSLSPCRKGFAAFAFFFTLGLNGFNSVVAQDTGAVPSPESGNFSSFPTSPQSINSILDTYEQLSGKRLIRDANLNGVPPISLNISNLSKAEGLKIIEETLLLNGVAILPVDEKTAKVIAAPNQAKNPRSEGVRLYANAADLPVDEQVVSYYMPLSYISAMEAKNIFDLNAPAHSVYGQYVVAPSAQAIILTENVSVIRQLIALKELIDVPPARVASEFVPLSRADATKTAKLINDLLGQAEGAVGAGGAAAPAATGNNLLVPASLGNTEPLLNEHNLISGPAKIVADTRSNRILVVTRPVNMPFLKNLIAQLDLPDTFMLPQTRPLKYVMAQDILPALQAALAQGKDEEDQIKKDGTSTSTPLHQESSNTPVSSASSSSGGGGSVSAITPQLQAPMENNAPTVITIGKARILADNRSNSLIVFGSPDIVSRTFAIVDQLDRKPLQVYLATVIGQLTVTEGMEFGIDILQKFQHVGQGGLASGLVTPGTAKLGSTSVPEPRSLTSTLGFPLPTGLTLYGAIGSTLNAYVRALESTNRFKVISRPSVYTTNNKLAVIASGSQVPVPSNTTSGFTGGDTLATTSSIAYENVLLQLDIIPLINANHEVTLKIRQTNNTLGTDNIISGNDVPTINTQEINTEVTVPDKSTVVIGGLISDNTTRTGSGVPWLSDIPIIGYLFSDTKKTKERDELIIMIQPTVVASEADQEAVDEAEKQRTILGQEAMTAAQGTNTKPAQVPLSRTDTKDAIVVPSAYNSKSGTGKAIPTYSTPTGSTTPLGPAPASPSTPDVSNGKLPKYDPASPPATAP